MPKGHFKGYKHSEETKTKIRLKLLGRKISPEIRKKMSEVQKGKVFSEERKKRISERMKGNKNGIGNKSGKGKIGENSNHWIKDRTKLAKKQKRNDSAYIEWAKTIKVRDGWKCKINNKDCNGKIIAHHILRWSEFPELRYDVNNGIALCIFHHPTKKENEVKLIPTFQGLITKQV